MVQQPAPQAPGMDSNEIRRLLFDAIRTLPEAQAYFEGRSADEELLKTLFEIALADPADAIRLQAGYYIARFPGEMLRDYETDLLRLQEEQWESLSEHAMVALAKFRSKQGLLFLIEKRLAPTLPWETKLLRSHLQDLIED
jgi:hypothetical protein